MWNSVPGFVAISNPLFRQRFLESIKNIPDVHPVFKGALSGCHDLGYEFDVLSDIIDGCYQDWLMIQHHPQQITLVMEDTATTVMEEFWYNIMETPFETTTSDYNQVTIREYLNGVYPTTQAMVNVYEMLVFSPTIYQELERNGDLDRILTPAQLEMYEHQEGHRAWERFLPHVVAYHTAVVQHWVQFLYQIMPHLHYIHDGRGIDIDYHVVNPLTAVFQITFDSPPRPKEYNFNWRNLIYD